MIKVQKTLQWKQKNVTLFLFSECGCLFVQSNNNLWSSSFFSVLVLEAQIQNGKEEKRALLER